MGGHVFKDPETKQPLTKPINREDIPTTAMWVELLVKIPFLSKNLLGSAGIADVSNDIDLAVEEGYYSKDEIYDRVVKYMSYRYPNDPLKTRVSRSGNCVHIRTPVCGNDDFGYVQTDLMFGNTKWLKWSLRGETTPGFKGRHRHILLASIAKYRGYRWSATKGVLTREGVLLTNRIEAVPSYVLGNDATVDDLESIDSIIQYMQKKPDWCRMVAEAEETLGHEGITLMERYNGTEKNRS